ncbi:hypothetical protein C8D77_112120 [Mesorhizobium loti]|uniref:Uncharacterized protein n=2 Tax=Mesorhizobium TaxID=68287 RepID=A0A8E2W7X5_RHILI|nr:hypothetical protein [Mesorhizobium loti]PWJ88224.1 hypothetical protein C8D77_112120 [Mesorhizobium loti]
MTMRSGRPPSDPYRKARFREIAREIVAKDRYNRKYGLSVDTAGTIANALERAYREGTRDGERGPAPVAEQPDSGPIEWALIPPRPRDAFWTICLFTLSRGDRPASSGRLVPAITERGTPGWMLDLQERTYEQLFGDRTIAPLVRLGLIAEASDDPAHRVVSKRGEETWGLFVQRGGQYPDDLTHL